MAAGATRSGRRRCAGAAPRPTGGQRPTAPAAEYLPGQRRGPAAHGRAHALHARFSRPRRDDVSRKAGRRVPLPSVALSGLEVGPKKSVEGGARCWRRDRKEERGGREERGRW